MSKPFVADLDQIDFPVVAAEGTTVFRVGADRLDIGMFVVDLDRPWADTPFPAGGLYIADKDQLATLRSHCASALVDLKWSDPGRASHIKVAAQLFDPVSEAERAAMLAGLRATTGASTAISAEPRKAAVLRQEPQETAPAPAAIPTAPPTRPVHAEGGRSVTEAAPSGAETASPVIRPRASGARDDFRVSRAWRQDLRRLMESNDRGTGLAEQAPGLLDRARSWFASPSRGTAAAGITLAGLQSTYGALVGAMHYPAPDTISAALPSARQAYARVIAAHAQAVRAARDGEALDWAPIGEATEALADSVIRQPDAVLWCDRMHEQRSLGNRPDATAAVLMAQFGRHLGLARSEIAIFAAIGLVADLGKERVPKELLNHPGQLSEDDFARLKSHVAESLNILAGATGAPAAVTRGVAQHHERANGSGYPARLKGTEISLHGACAAIVDCYTALISARSYANPLSPEDALAALLGWSPALFDPALAEHFALAMGLYPVGSCVELTGGGLGLITAQNLKAPANSKVLVLIGADGKPPPPQSKAKPGKAGDAPRASSPGVRAGDGIRIERGMPVGAFGVKLPDCYLNTTESEIR